MALDMKAIADGLATRYASLTPPTGYTAIKKSTAELPNNVNQWPTVLVYPPDGSLVYGAQERTGEHDFAVLFLYAQAQGDLVRESAALLEWLGVLLDATHAAAQLGEGPTVRKAIPTSYAIGDVPYGGQTYDGITLSVRVFTHDTVTLVLA